MKNNHLYLWISGAALVATAATILVSNTSESVKGLITPNTSAAITGSYIHFRGVDPTESTRGIREYWTDANCKNPQFYEPSGTKIADRDVPSSYANAIKADLSDERCLPSFNDLDGMYSSYNSAFPMSYEAVRFNSALAAFSNYSDAAKANYKTHSSEGYFNLELVKNSYKVLTSPDTHPCDPAYHSYTNVEFTSAQDSELFDIKLYQRSSSASLYIDTNGVFGSNNSQNILVWVKNYSGTAIRIYGMDTTHSFDMQKEETLSNASANWCAYYLSSSQTASLKSDNPSKVSITPQGSDLSSDIVISGFFGVDFNNSLKLAASYSGASDSHYTFTPKSLSLLSDATDTSNRGYSFVPTHTNNDWWYPAFTITESGSWEVHDSCSNPFVYIYCSRAAQLYVANGCTVQVRYGPSKMFGDNVLPNTANIPLSAGWNKLSLNETYINNLLRRNKDADSQTLKLNFYHYGTQGTGSYFISPIFAESINKTGPSYLVAYGNKYYDPDYNKSTYSGVLYDKADSSDPNNYNGLTMYYNASGDPNHGNVSLFTTSNYVSQASFTEAYIMVFASRGIYLADTDTYGSTGTVYGKDKAGNLYNFTSSQNYYLGGGDWTRINLSASQVYEFLNSESGDYFINLGFDFLDLNLASTPVDVVVSPIYLR